MDKVRGWFGRKVAPPTTRETRSSRHDSNMRLSLNEDREHLGFLNFDGIHDVQDSAYPCNDLLTTTGIYDQFYELIDNAGLLDFTTREVNQYRKITYIFVQTFKFNDESNPIVEFYLYHQPKKMSLNDFSRALRLPNEGITKIIKHP